MAEIDQAAEAVQSFAEQFKSVMVLAEASKKLGSMENATREREAALKKATEEHEAKQKELNSVTAMLAEKKKQYTQEVTDHHKALQAATDANQKGAREAVERAHSDATKIIKQAQEEAARLTKLADEAREDAYGQLTAIQAEHTKVAEALIKRRAEYDKLAKEMADLRKAAQRIVA